MKTIDTMVNSKAIKPDLVIMPSEAADYRLKGNYYERISIDYGEYSPHNVAPTSRKIASFAITAGGFAAGEFTGVKLLGQSAFISTFLGLSGAALAWALSYEPIFITKQK